MAYNKNYNTRKSAGGRYNTGGFVPAEAPQPIPSYTSAQGNNSFTKIEPPPPPPPVVAQSYNTYAQDEQMYDSSNDVQMKNENEGNGTGDSEAPAKPHWMKTKLDGVKKISNKERRRRQNKNLRRLLSPKNALMTLNELMPGAQVLNNMKVEESVPQYFSGNMKNSFLAEVNLSGQVYKGFGESKNAARNTAAEQAIRDLLVKKLNTITNIPEPTEGEEEEEFPMLQLASFALHKLFHDWNHAGTPIPSLKALGSNSTSGSESGKTPAAKPPKPAKTHPLPVNAAQLHPASLLHYMRGAVEYRELGVEGVNPPNVSYTVGIDIEGTTYIGKAGSKKEARRNAAKAACEAVYGVKFDPTPTANIPQPPTN